MASAREFLCGSFQATKVSKRRIPDFCWVLYDDKEGGVWTILREGVKIIPTFSRMQLAQDYIDQFQLLEYKPCCMFWEKIRERLKGKVSAATVDYFQNGPCLPFSL